MAMLIAGILALVLTSGRFLLRYVTELTAYDHGLPTKFQVIGYVILLYTPVAALCGAFFGTIIGVNRYFRRGPAENRWWIPDVVVCIVIGLIGVAFAAYAKPLIKGDLMNRLYDIQLNEPPGHTPERMFRRHFSGQLPGELGSNLDSLGGLVEKQKEEILQDFATARDRESRDSLYEKFRLTEIGIEKSDLPDVGHSTEGGDIQAEGLRIAKLRYLGNRIRMKTEQIRYLQQQITEFRFALVAPFKFGAEALALLLLGVLFGAVTRRFHWGVPVAIGGILFPLWFFATNWFDLWIRKVDGNIWMRTLLPLGVLLLLNVFVIGLLAKRKQNMKSTPIDSGKQFGSL